MKNFEITEAVYTHTGSLINEKLKINDEGINNIGVGADASVRPLPKKNTQNGITLLALIITIIVLLILAIVSIKIIKDGGIITHAQNATNNYKNEENKEKDLLNALSKRLAEINGETVEIPDEIYAKNEDSNFGFLNCKVYDKDGKELKGVVKNYLKTDWLLTCELPDKNDKDYDGKSEYGSFELDYVGNIEKSENISIPTTLDACKVTFESSDNEDEGAEFIKISTNNTTINIEDIMNKTQDGIDNRVIKFNISGSDDNIIKTINLNSMNFDFLMTFYNLKSLEKIEGTDGVKKINDQSFDGCTNIKEVEFKNLVYANSKAFANSSLEIITLPGKGLSFQNDSFDNMKKLKEFRINGSEAECDYASRLPKTNANGDTIKITYLQ